MVKKRFKQLFAGNSESSHDADMAPEGSPQDEIARLKQSLETLKIVNRLAVGMSEAASPEEAVEKLVDQSMRTVDAEQATVTLFDGDEAATSQKETQVRVFRSSANQGSFHVNDMLIGWMWLNKKPLVINDPHNDTRFRSLVWDITVRSVMCLPLMSKAQLIGVLTIYNKRGQSGFTESDEEMGAVIGAHSAQLIENVRLAKDKNRIEEQLNLATEIQSNLLPAAAPIIDGYDIAGKSIPAQSVGGDYFDFIPIDEHRHAICLGDVSGKGLPASLLMANVQATLRGQTMVDAPIDERMNRSNKLICRCTDDERFVTLWYGVLDSAAHTIEFCSAGHEHPFLVSANGDVSRLEATGLALGVIDGVTYQKKSVTMAPGDTIVVYSDGVPDATNTGDELFGADRLNALITQHHGSTARDMVERVMTAVAAHAGSAPQFDDLTLVVIKRNK